jgi:hypothetical protein
VFSRAAGASLRLDNIQYFKRLLFLLSSQRRPLRPFGLTDTVFFPDERRELFANS